MQKAKKEQGSNQSETTSQNRVVDYVLERMKRDGEPLTRARYVELSWPVMKESDLGPELLAEIPDELE